MKWIEIIQLRTAGVDRQSLIAALTQIMDECDNDGTMVIAYERTLVDTDFCIHIMQDTPEIASHGSSLGLQLSHALKAFGMTHHSVWSELPGNPLLNPSVP